MKNMFNSIKNFFVQGVYLPSQERGLFPYVRTTNPLIVMNDKR